MNRSSKFNFFLPQNTDPIDVSDFNSNFETIDANLLTKAQNLSSDQKAAVRANVDLNVANNLTTTAGGSVLDARMGKTLGDAINTLNSNFVYDWSPFTNYVSPDEKEANGVIARLGKIRSISYRGVSRVHTEDEVIATLPEGDRPSYRIYVTGNIGGTCVVVSINNNGQITIYTLNGATTSARLFFGITYIIQ